MLGFFTAVYSGLAFIFACIGIAVISYQLYQWCLKRRANNVSLNREFEEIRGERLQREGEISIYATDSTLHLQNNAHQVVERFKEQLAHLDVSITAFDQALEHTQHANNGLDEARRSLTYTIIEPMKVLLDRIKSQFDQSRAFVSTLSDAFTQSTAAVKARERELAVVIQNFSEMEVSLRNAQLQLESVTKIKEENQALQNCVKSMTEKIYELIEINDKQDRLINVLQQPQNEVSISHDCRLFGNRLDRALSSVDGEEKQDITTASIGSSYIDAAITV